MPKEKNNKKKEWRKAVQKAMREATEKEVARKFGSQNASFNYRWEHVTAVVKLAMRLARLTGADAEVVEAAAWLHDIRKEVGDDHPQAGAKFARQFLPKTTFPADKIERVALAIEQHMGLWRDEPLTNLEAQVLWDADKLAKIGLTAVFHWTGGSLAGDKLRTVDEIIARGRAADWQAQTVASMHTEPARRAAAARLHAYTWLWDELERELSGEDLEG
ncbi:MAG: HD domain-containing protein [Anaerolineales bacterium]|nr:HD domain-containing protein [Anaerolineales bacterium]